MPIPTQHKLRLASMASRSLLFCRRIIGKNHVARARRQSLTWELNLLEGIDLSIFLLGAFDKPALRCYASLLEPVRHPIVVDVGANCGSHALPLAELIARKGGGQVLALEPAADAYARLCRNLELNPRIIDIVNPMQVLAWNESTETSPSQTYSSWPLDRNPLELHPVHGGLLSSTQGAVTLTLDSLVAELNLPKVDLIKIDVDGNEFEVLQGSVTTIKRHRPSLIIEWAPHLANSPTRDLQRTIASLVNEGYQLGHIPSLAPISGGAGALDQFASSTGSFNFVLVWTGN